MKKQVLALILGTALLSGCGTLCDEEEACTNCHETQAVVAKSEPAPTPAPRVVLSASPTSSSFRIDSFRLSASDKAKLDKLADELKESGERIRINGYTDITGSAEYNQELSEKRAQSVADYLVSKGVSRNKIRTTGYGATHFIAPNNTAAVRAKNRRVEVLIED